MIRQIVLAAALLSANAVAQAPGGPRFELRGIPAPTDGAEIPLYPAGAVTPGPTPESWAKLVGDFPDGAHMAWRIVRNVAQPTITPVLPARKANGAAVVVAPGGAFLSLSMDTEGFQVARELADRGIAAFVLKYRVNPTPADDAAFNVLVGQRMGEAVRAGGAVAGIGEPRAYQDALQALKLIRAGSAKWRVDPARVGIVGFSAGAMTALQSVLTAPAATDRPKFLGYIYGPMVPVAVPAGAPPMFTALALDDPLFGRQGFGIVDAWRQAGAGVELHAYQRGDHGFGVGRPGTTSTLVIDEFVLWLDSNGFLKPLR